MNWKEFARVLYPLLIATLLTVLLFLSSRSDSLVYAGVIRTVDLSPDRPLVVRLAQGHTTAISFAVRPEKVVPGNPQAIEINFLGRDLTVRPLAPHPGNLIVYTKSGRYVILLQISSESSYDDVVSVRSLSPGSRPVRLENDSFTIEEFILISGQSKVHVSAQIKSSRKVGTFQDLPKGLRCKSCVLKEAAALTEVTCSAEIVKLNCNVGKQAFQLERASHDR